MKQAFRHAALLGATGLLLAGGAAAEEGGLCSRWSEPGQGGALDVSVLHEASGIAVGSGGRLYHVNDGGKPVFHVTDASGGGLQTVRVSGVKAVDIEDMTYGRCGDANCLVLADTGDNAQRREAVQFILVRETEKFGAEVKPLHVVRARYPDRPHDAEAVALHPGGDLLLVTKSPLGLGGPSVLFRLRAEQLAAGGEQAFQRLGEIPVPQLTEHGLTLRRMVTSMDVSPDGRRLLLLTYDSAIEIALQPGAGLPAEWKSGLTHRATPIMLLLQAEAVAYEDGGRGIVYSTESLRGSAVPLVRQRCLD
jgi:hypothetical protein